MATRTIITEIERFSLYDGPGIRTTVFLKGCPLQCVWCHNPECMSHAVQLSYREQSCVQCGRCAAVCPHGVHSMEGGHTVDFSRCTACGKCVRVCQPKALAIWGKEMKPEEVMQIVLRDMKYYASSGGGLTVSGGEPLANADFTEELLRLAREKGIHTAVETSGFGPTAALERIMPWTDLFLLDYKETDPVRHEAYTGVSNQRILQHLDMLIERGNQVVLRCPIIPGYNDREEHYAGIAELLRRYPAIQRCECMAYHTMGAAKYKQLGKSYTVESKVFTEDEKSAILTRINELTPIQVVWG